MVAVPPSARKGYALPSLDTKVVRTLMRDVGLPRIVASILVLRGITTSQAALEFLAPSLERDWCDPCVIPGLEDVATEVLRCIEAQEKLLIFGDFDVDGISATAILACGLRAFGAQVQTMIPHRLDEGYGLTDATLQRIFLAEPDLVVTVDNGIAAAREVAILRERNIRVAVTDHHEPGDLTPQGIAVADPKLDADSPSRELAGVGVALKLVQFLGAKLGKPDVWRSYLDIATLGTIADQVSLRGENRALVTSGLEKMNTDPNPSIAAFKKTSTRDEVLTADGLSYSLLPRINSAGRMGDPQVALDFLLARNLDDASEHMAMLEQINTQRRACEAEVSESALALIEREYTGQRAIVYGSPDWHEGIKGIVASRIVTRYGAPTILFTITPEGVAHGSGRSVGEVNLFKAVQQCSDLLTRFGGHEMAVGITLPASSIPQFRERLCSVLDELPAEQFIPTSNVDLEVELSEVNLDLLDELDHLAPFGQDNKMPTFVARHVVLCDRRALGTPAAHFSCNVSDGCSQVRGIYFNAPDLEKLMSCETPVDVIFQASRNEYRGRCSAQLLIKAIIPLDENPAGEDDETIADLFARSDEFLDTGEYAGILDASSFYTKLAGVTFEGRQELLAALPREAQFELVREPDNSFDTNAIAVYFDGRQLGYLNARLAAHLAPAIDAGTEYQASLSELTGGDGEHSLGANILVCKTDAARAVAEQARERLTRRQHWISVPAAQLTERLREEFIGTHALHDAQIESLNALEHGQNTLTVMATGRGKSLIFHIHAARMALLEQRVSVFIYPLRALVADQFFHLQEAFDRIGLAVCVLTGETSENERTSIFASIASGAVDCVLTTPEFLAIHAARFVATGRIGFLVVDEAHHVGMMRGGHRQAYTNIAQTRHALGDPLVLAVTATAGDEVARNIVEALDIKHVVLDPSVRDNLHIDEGRDRANRDLTLAHLLAMGEKLIVYVNSRDQSIKLARMLRKAVPSHAHEVAFYHAGLPRSSRKYIETAFREGRLCAVVSTSAFGEGVDIPDIRHVVLYHLPFNEVEFNQMAGRGGRDGNDATVHLLFSARDAKINERILSSSAPPRQDLVALYRVLRACAHEAASQEDTGEEHTISLTNAELAEKCSKLDARTSIGEQGVSCGLSVFRELQLIETRGRGSARVIVFLEDAGKVELSQSARYAEGCREREDFASFRQWALEQRGDTLLAHFNRPILPSIPLV